MFNRLKELLFPTGATDRSDARALQLATAVLLIEVMLADSEILAEEQETVLAALKQQFGLLDPEAEMLMRLGERTAKDAYDFHRFTSLLNSELDSANKVRIVECMWQVAYSDAHLSAHENHLMRKIADLLHISHADYIAAKLRARDRCAG